MPYFSIIMPAYNAQKYLAIAIQSCLNQTFTDFELIVIDDLSTDKTPEIASDFAKIDSRIRIIKGSHAGIVSVRKLGFETAIGEYIVSLDADDSLYPNSLSTIKAAIDEYGEVDLVNFFWRKINKNGFNLEKSRNPHQRSGNYQTNDAKDFDYLIRNSCLTDVWKNAIKRDLVISTKINYPFQYAYFSEAIILLQLFRAAKRMVVLQKTLVNYRILPNSLSRRKTPTDLDAMEKMIKLAKSFKFLDETEKDQIGFFLYSTHIASLIEGLALNKKLDRKEALEQIHNSHNYSQYHQQTLQLLIENNIQKKSKLLKYRLTIYQYFAAKKYNKLFRYVKFRKQFFRLTGFIRDILLRLKIKEYK